MELTKLQKILLAVLAAMLAVFGGMMAFSRAHPGVAFEEGLLKVSGNEERMLYSGKVQGAPVTIAVAHPGGALTEVDVTIGEKVHDVCRVEYPLDVIRTERGDLVRGIRIVRNGETLFEGGYDPESDYGWYTSEGEWAPFGGISIRGSGEDPWDGYETDIHQIVRFAFGVEAQAAYGDPLMFFMAALLSVLAVIQILFHRTLFRWRHWGARDPEPTEAYLFLDKIGWIALILIAAGFYLGAMTTIY